MKSSNIAGKRKRQTKGTGTQAHENESPERAKLLEERERLIEEHDRLFKKVLENAKEIHRLLKKL